MPAPASAFLVASGETGHGAGPAPAPVRRLFPAECQAVGRLQRPAFGGRAHVPVAVDDAGSCGEGRILAHARVAGGHAGRAPPVRFGRAGAAATSRSSILTATSP